MKKTLLTSILAITFAIPAFATIESGSTCDTSNLGQSENNSTANVEADWTANTININWYIDGDAQTTLATNTCTYDGTITLPQQPTKTGYTFNGWQLRAAVLSCANYLNQQDCSKQMECHWLSENNTCVNMYDYTTSFKTESECTSKGFVWCPTQDGNKCIETEILCMLQ